VTGVSAYQNGSILQGAFDRTPSLLCRASAVKTIYVKEGASSTGTGTKIKPYDSIAKAQTALETDSSIKRVCFSGALDGTLDLDAALATDLTLTAYAVGTTLSSTGIVFHQEIGALQNLTISNLEIDGGLVLAPTTSLTLSRLDVDGDGRSNAVGIGEADSVTISDSTITDTDVGIETSLWETDAVGTLEVSNVIFETTYDTAISAYFLDSLTVSDSTFEYANYGIVSHDVTTLLIEKSTFLGGTSAIAFDNTNTDLTSLDLQNNFIGSNSYSGLRDVSAHGSNVNTNINNNSFYNNLSTSALGGETFINNIVYSYPSQRAFYSTTYAATLTSDYNLFYGRLSTDPAALDLASWQTKTGLDLNSLVGDPLFTSTDDLHLSSSTSPAIDAGTDLSVTEDIDGDSRPAGSFDIGADEYQAP